MYKKMLKVIAGICGILLIASVMLSGAGCGGGDGFDTFRGRAATIADLEEKTFTFSFVSNGAPFNPSLGDQPTTVSFGQFDATNMAPFTLRVKDSAASGLAAFNDSRLTLTITEVAPSLPFSVGQEIVLDVLADVDDGRISVTNVETGLETTSEPK